MKALFLLTIVLLTNCVLPPRDVYSAEVHNLMSDRSTIRVRVVCRCVGETQTTSTFLVKFGEAMEINKVVLENKSGTKFICPVQEILIGKRRRQPKEESTKEVEDEKQSENKLRLKAPFDVTAPTKKVHVYVYSLNHAVVSKEKIKQELTQNV